MWMSEGIETVDKDTALEIVDDLRTRAGTAFEAVITDKAGELFNAD